MSVREKQLVRFEFNACEVHTPDVWSRDQMHELDATISGKLPVCLGDDNRARRICSSPEAEINDLGSRTVSVSTGLPVPVYYKKGEGGLTIRWKQSPWCFSHYPSILKPAQNYIYLDTLIHT